MLFPGDDTPFGEDVAFAPGISLAIDATPVFESAAAASCLRRQIFDLAMAGLDISLAVEHSSPDTPHRMELEFVFGLVAEAMRQAAAATSRLVVVVDARSIGPRAAWRMRCRQLGAATLYLRAGPESIADPAWRQAWELRTTKQLGLLYVPLLFSPCRLLPAELATAFIPGPNVQGPPGTAWAALAIDIDAAADAGGRIETEVLDAAVRDTVAAGERLHAGAHWPTARLRHDAWLNRRLAIDVSGIGSLVRRRGLDPESFAALDEMSRLVRRIRDVAVAESQRIAAASGHLPALEQADLSNSLPGGRLRDGWSRRWRSAVQATAVRHRNLLVMSPWSLFPRDDADFRYANLLPLLRFADTCAFGTPPDLRHWSLSQFKRFHRQAAAVLHQRGVTHQIAVSV